MERGIEGGGVEKLGAPTKIARLRHTLQQQLFLFVQFSVFVRSETVVRAQIILSPPTSPNSIYVFYKTLTLYQIRLEEIF